MMYRKRVLLLFEIIVLVFFISSCANESETEDLNPANLTIDIIIADDNSGKIDVTATADKTVGFEFYAGEIPSEDPVYNSDGIFSHTYTKTGTYTVEVRAIGTSGKYVKKEPVITVQVGDVEPIDPTGGYTTPLTYPNMNLVWQDEFDGNALNESDWTHEIGNGNSGWGNNELQYYRKDNTSVRNGFLTIEAREQDFSGRRYTSSRIITKGKQDFLYGRIDIRAKLPKGQGIWPATWMLGSNISSVGWPKCGEIDIMELVGGSGDNTSHGTIHWYQGGNANYGGDYKLNNGIFNDQFHVFTIIWTSASIQWYVDDVKFHEADITPSGLSEFHLKEFFIFNVAVGGNWPGSPNASTVFPQQMVVDYIRVFQDE